MTIKQTLMPGETYASATTQAARIVRGPTYETKVTAATDPFQVPDHGPDGWRLVSAVFDGRQFLPFWQR